MPPKEPEPFGVVMRRTREARGMSLTDLRELTGLTEVLLDLFERSIVYVNPIEDTTERIVEALDDPELRRVWKWHMDKARFERRFGPGASN